MSAPTSSAHDSMKLNAADVERLVTDHYANLFRFALSLARNEAEAADLTQQTFFQLASKGGQIRELSKAKSWLFTTLHREFLSMRRRSDRFSPIEDAEKMPDEAPEIELDVVRKSDAAVVMKAMNSIRETYRVPLSLFYLDDLSYKEIATILEVPVGTVMSRLSRGKSELRAVLSRLLDTDQIPGNVVAIDNSVRSAS